MASFDCEKKSFYYCSWFIDLILLTLCLAGFYVLWLGHYALFVPDESRYCEVAREMWVSKNYITPHLNGVIFLDKPILYYWLQVLAIKWFGLHEWSLRFWPAALGVLNCLVAYIAGRVLYNRLTGILTAIILATSPLFFMMSHYANLDGEVAVWLSITLLIVLMVIKNINQRQNWLWLAYVSVGLAILTKGLMGIILPALIIGIWIIVLRKWQIILRLRLFSGLLIVIVITVPWFVLVQQANPDFLHYFFIKQQFNRYLSANFNDAESPVFYFPVLFFGFFPWILFLVQALWQQCKMVWRDYQSHTVEIFLLLWPFIIFIFFSIPHSKTIGYITPIMTPFSLLVGSYLAKQFLQTEKIGFNTGITLFSFLVALAVIGLFYLHFHSYLIATFLLIMLIVLLVLFKRKQMALQFIAMVIIMGVSLLSFLHTIPYLNKHSIKPLALFIKWEVPAHVQLVTYYLFYYDLPFYTQRQITVVSDWENQAVINGDTWEHELSNGKRDEQSRQWLLDYQTFWQQWRSTKPMVVLINEQVFNTFRAYAGQYFYLLTHYRGVYVIANHR